MLTVTDANNHTVTNKYDADGHLDSFTYNGLGMRLTKRDPSGNYAYFADGLTPASSVLSDNFTTFTPGISEYNALGSRFYLADASGNSRGLLNGSSVDTDGYNWEAFGTLVSRFGNDPTGFAWNVDSGYQADNDDGLALLGHRYYDKRTGRFISQDPAGDGDNWYGYADNDPVNKTDPSGLAPMDGPGSSAMGTPGFMGGSPVNGFGDDDSESYEHNQQVTQDIETQITQMLNTLASAKTDAAENGGGPPNEMACYITFHGFTTKQVKYLRYLLKLISSTPVGHELVEYAMNSTHDYQIINSKGMDADHQGAGYTFTGPVYINPAYHPSINTVGGKIDASTLRILAHELGHAVDGYSDSYDLENPTPGNRMMNVDKVENPIMKVIAGPNAARTSYP